MIVDKLKKSILNFAFQGKLTDRLNTDSSVDDLLKQINNEKKDTLLNLIDEDEIPFIIPKEWKWVRWGNLSSSIQYGINTGAKSKGNAKLVRISDIQNNEIMWNNVPYCEVNDTEVQQYLLFENDILFARTGGTVGKSVVVKNIPTDIPYIFAGYLIRSNYNSKINYNYLKLFMESNLYWSQLKNGTIGSAQPNCNGKTLSKMILPLPPVEEQQRIVNKIEKLFSKLDEIKPIENELNNLKFNFSNKMKNSILDKILKNYSKNMITLGKIADINGGYSFKSHLYTKDGIRIIRISDFDENGIKKNKPVYYNYDTSFEQYRLINGNIIMCMTGGTVGKNALLCNIPNNYFTNQRVATIKVNEKFLSKFIFYCINSYYIQKIIHHNKNSTNDNISLNTIKSFPIPNISLKEQSKIVDKLEELLPLCDDIEKLVGES